MKYTTPEIEILELSQTDVIEASGGNMPSTGEDDFVWVPAQ